MMTAGDVTAPSASLSARRAWIEIAFLAQRVAAVLVALRKESVDRNTMVNMVTCLMYVALRKESVDRNPSPVVAVLSSTGRSPQGERG